MEASPTTRGHGAVNEFAGSRMLLLQPDAVLCKLAARGNTNAYDALYQRYHRPVFAFVFHMLGRRDSAEDAEDIAQESFTKAFAGIGQKRSDGSFKHWIYMIARNRTLDHMRASGRAPVSLDDETVEIQASASSASASSEAEDRAEFAWLVAAMGALPDRQREALVMRELGGMSHNEIAEALETTVPATKKLISRGRASVGDAAHSSGVRSRRLGRELAMAAPLPVAAAGIGLGGMALGGGAAIGGAAASTKIAATVLAAVAIGGGAVAVSETRSGDSGGSPTADQTQAPEQQGGAGQGDGGGNGAADSSGHGGKRGSDDDSSDSSGRGKGSDDSGSRQSSGNDDGDSGGSHRGRSRGESEESGSSHSGSGGGSDDSVSEAESGDSGGDSEAGEDSTPEEESSGGDSNSGSGSGAEDPVKQDESP